MTSSPSLSHALAVSHSVPSLSPTISQPPVSSLIVLTGFYFFFPYSSFCLTFSSRLLSLSPLVQSDLSVGEWQQDGNSGNTSRVLSYTISLNNPLGPKTAPVVETQVSLRCTAASDDWSDVGRGRVGHIQSLYLHAMLALGQLQRLKKNNNKKNSFLYSCCISLNGCSSHCISQVYM